MPSAFAPTDEAVHELLLRHRAADLVTAGPDGLAATMLPFLYDARAPHPARSPGPQQRPLAHARTGRRPW